MNAMCLVLLYAIVLSVVLSLANCAAAPQGSALGAAKHASGGAIAECCERPCAAV